MLAKGRRRRRAEGVFLKLDQDLWLGWSGRRVVHRVVHRVTFFFSHRRVLASHLLCRLAEVIAEDVGCASAAARAAAAQEPRVIQGLLRRWPHLGIVLQELADEVGELGIVATVVGQDVGD